MRHVVSASIITTVVAAAAAVFFTLPALAKLPASSDEAKAKAAETAAKAAWTDKLGGYQLCKATDRIVETYRKTAASSGKPAPAAVETLPCADPGAFVAPVAPVATAASAAPPLEAAGAHSPPKTATAPPSSKETSAEIQGKAKK